MAVGSLAKRLGVVSVGHRCPWRTAVGERERVGIGLNGKGRGFPLPLLTCPWALPTYQNCQCGGWGLGALSQPDVRLVPNSPKGRKVRLQKLEAIQDGPMTKRHLLAFKSHHD